MDKYNLTKHWDDWKLKKEGAERATKVFDWTKAESLKESIEFMKSHWGSLKIHLEKWGFQEERTYPRSVDPTQSPG